MKVYDQDSNLVGSLEPYGMNDRPYDVTAVKFSQSVVLVYAAILNASNRHFDYVMCYRGTRDAEGEWSWDSNRLKWQGNTVAEFPLLLNLSVLQYDLQPDYQLAMLAFDVADGYGIKISQVTLGYNNLYYAFSNFYIAAPPVSPIFAEGFALGIADDSVNTGYFYFVGDKDPGLNVEGGASEGENVFVYQNAW